MTTTTAPKIAQVRSLLNRNGIDRTREGGLVMFYTVADGVEIQSQQGEWAARVASVLSDAGREYRTRQVGLDRSATPLTIFTVTR